MEKLSPTIGENVCVSHRHGASLAKIVTVTRDKVRLRYESWLPQDEGEPEFDARPEDLSPIHPDINKAVRWSTYRDRTVSPSPELLDAFLKKPR